MKRNHLFVFGSVAALALAGPAAATQGISCKSASLELALGAGTYPGATWWAKEKVDGEWVDREVGQQWIDDRFLLLDLVDSEAMTVAARIIAQKVDGMSWRGTVTIDGRDEAIRCEIS